MSEPPIWAKAKKRQYEKHENSLAEKGGHSGHKQLNSGRSWFSKRDVTLFGFLFEARTKEGGKTSEYTHTIDVRELKKLSQNAFFHNLLPGMAFEWPDHKERWILIREGDFEQQMENFALARSEVMELEERLAQYEGEG